MRFGAVLGLGLTVGALLVAGCAAGNNTTNTGGSGGQGATGGSGGNTGGSGATGAEGGAGPGGSGPGGGPSCAKFTAEAEQAPAAMLIALDMSSSMTASNKWGAAQLAVVGAIDKDIFDSMSLGLVTFPLLQAVNGPSCLFGFPVHCGVSALPQVAIAPAGKDKSNAGTGVRHNIYQFLVSNSPMSTADDGSPVYEGMDAGYKALQLQSIDRRVLVVITDGGFSCTSMSNRGGYLDLNGCPDWEYPSSVNELITKARTDPEKPVFTFVIGVPGSDTTGSDPNSEPPYNMLHALSTYARNGSPDTVDPACDPATEFNQNAGAPAVPCHFDLSSGAAFNADALANAIQSIKGKALGCVYDLPPPPAGETVDLSYVNVETTIDGITSAVLKRSNPSDDCKVDGCWDYNAETQVVLLGKTCDDITKAQSAKVDIKVGCETVVK